MNSDNLTWLLCSVICLAPLAGGFVLGWSIRAKTMGKGLYGLLPEFIRRMIESEEE